MEGLTGRHRGRRPWKLTARVRARVLAATRRPPPDGTTHWSCRRLAAHLGVGKDIVQRVWREADLRPHRLARYMASNDPDFETKATDIIGLYLDPPRHAAVFCIDEKTAIQALDRRDRVLPLSPGRVERHGFEYKRHGTLSLYAALNVRTGEVQRKTTARHTSLDFVGFLGEVVATRHPTRSTYGGSGMEKLPHRHVLRHLAHREEDEVGGRHLFDALRGAPASAFRHALPVDPGVGEPEPFRRHVVVMQALRRVQHVRALQPEVRFQVRQAGTRSWCPTACRSRCPRQCRWRRTRHPACGSTRRCRRGARWTGRRACSGA